MFVVRYKSKTENQELIDLGCPEWIDIVCAKFNTLKAAAEYCRNANKHNLKFHPEKNGKCIYYVKEYKK